MSLLCCSSIQTKNLYSADCTHCSFVRGRIYQSKRRLLIHHHCRSEYRQECLWSVMKMYLLQMAEDCGEVDVFQTVYHVYNSIPFQSSPPPSNYYNAPSPSSSQHLELNVNTYKNMYDFALSICRKGRLEGPRAEKLEEDNYHKAQKRNNVYNNEALCYSNDETKKIINRTYEKNNNIGNSSNNNNNNNNVITNMTKSLYPSKEGEIGEKDNSY